jgi:hypothetical protein
MKLGLFLLFFLFSTLLFSSEKTPSDVYAESIVLKKMVIELRKENGVRGKLPFIEVQRGKLPRHVLQKTLEVLTKVNKYREINNFGEITLPPVPPRDITPQDVYNNVKRLKVEVAYLLKDKSILSKKRFAQQKFKDKTPSDVYRVLWSVSLGFDKLLGQGFTPTDVYAQTQEIVERIKFLRETQRENSIVPMPILKKNQHPNHALYKSIDLIKELCRVEKKLWMKPVPIPKVQHKIISPTEVYDSLQTVNAELNRISRRLGVERSFEVKNTARKKTPSDVVQNLEYAIALLPHFDFSKQLNQFPKTSLIKTPNDVYAVSEFILKKIKKIKLQKGIHVKAKETSYIYGLKPIHVYVKGVEDLEKVAKLKKLEGFKPSESPGSPTTKITPSEVYELILRLDDELNLIYKGKGIIPYRESINKQQYSDKTSSDVYDVLWKISYELDSMLNQDYTPNETYILAKKIQNDVSAISEYFLKKNIKLHIKKTNSKRPEDVFNESLKLLDKLQTVKKRGNLKSVQTAIPKDKLITPTSVYNALRIISATVTEIHVYFGINSKNYDYIKVDNKTPSDVYSVVEVTNRILKTVLEDSSYEN